jgi:hypothetical protein
MLCQIRDFSERGRACPGHLRTAAEARMARP